MISMCSSGLLLWCGWCCPIPEHSQNSCSSQAVSTVPSGTRGFLWSKVSPFGKLQFLHHLLLVPLRSDITWNSDLFPTGAALLSLLQIFVLVLCAGGLVNYFHFFFLYLAVGKPGCSGSCRFPLESPLSVEFLG